MKNNKIAKTLADECALKPLIAETIEGKIDGLRYIEFYEYSEEIERIPNYTMTQGFGSMYIRGKTTRTAKFKVMNKPIRSFSHIANLYIEHLKENINSLLDTLDTERKNYNKRINFLEEAMENICRGCRLHLRCAYADCGGHYLYENDINDNEIGVYNKEDYLAMPIQCEKCSFGNTTQKEAFEFMNWKEPESGCPYEEE